MRSKTIIGIIAVLAIFLGVIIISFSNNIDGWILTPIASPTHTFTPTSTYSLTPIFTSTATYTSTFSPSFTPTETSTLTATPTTTFMVVCTPPPCAIGTSEIYLGLSLDA